MNYIITSIFRYLYILSMALCAISSYTFGDDNNDEYLYEGDEQESTLCYSRYSFPTTCQEHFSNNIATMHTWMEAEDPETVKAFSKYLQVIPKIYVADCCQCYDCSGVKFNMYKECEFPTDEDAFEELRKCHEQSRRGRGKYCTKDSDHCETSCWNGAYFRLWNHKYLYFFKHFLQYCRENDDCKCFWPERNQDATDINNRVYILCKDLADKGVITPEFSSFWIARMIEFNYKGKTFTDAYYPNSHGMASSLTT